MKITHAFGMHRDVRKGQKVRQRGLCGAPLKEGRRVAFCRRPAGRVTCRRCRAIVMKYRATQREYERIDAAADRRAERALLNRVKVMRQRFGVVASEPITSHERFAVNRPRAWSL